MLLPAPKNGHHSPTTAAHIKITEIDPGARAHLEHHNPLPGNKPERDSRQNGDGPVQDNTDFANIDKFEPDQKYKISEHGLL